MNISREVVNDLLPVYFSGEASAETRRIVEEFFRSDPDFERTARSAAMPLDTLKGAAWPVLLPQSEEAEKEKRDLECVRGTFFRKRIFFGVALFFSLAPFAFVFENGHIVWMMVRNAPWDAALYWTLAAFFWTLYFARVRYRTFSLIAGCFLTILPALIFLYSTHGATRPISASDKSDLIWETVLFWGTAAGAWLTYFARLGLRTRALIMAIFLTLIPLPFFLYPVLSGGPRLFSTLGEPIVIWCVAAVIWLRYLFLRKRPGAGGSC